jgi:hypothetical protein
VFTTCVAVCSDPKANEAIIVRLMDAVLLEQND